MTGSGRLFEHGAERSWYQTPALWSSRGSTRGFWCVRARVPRSGPIDEKARRTRYGASLFASRKRSQAGPGASGCRREGRARSSGRLARQSDLRGRPFQRLREEADGMRDIEPSNVGLPNHAEVRLTRAGPEEPELARLPRLTGELGDLDEDDGPHTIGRVLREPTVSCVLVTACRLDQARTRTCP